MMTLPMLSALLLMGLLMAAVIFDLRARRIPNLLVLYGLLVGLCLQTVAPRGNGLLQDGGLGMVGALLGGFAGLALFLPFYLVRALGAGDVKLMAMVGIWLGTPAVLHAVLWSMLAGGLLSLAMALASSTLRQTLLNTFMVLVARAVPSLQAPSQAASSVRLPYAVAIAIGSAVEMARLAAF